MCTISGSLPSKRIEQFVFQCCIPRKSKCPDLTSADLYVISHDWSFLEFPIVQKTQGRNNTAFVYYFIDTKLCFVFTLSRDGWIRWYFQCGHCTGWLRTRVIDEFDSSHKARVVVRWNRSPSPTKSEWIVSALLR